jgi:hypothetical protein
MMTIKEMMNRIKGLSYHEVTIALSAPLRFNGVGFTAIKNALMGRFSF